jgi:hypothetical protein
MREIVKDFGFAVILVSLIVCAPLAVVWALNTLFSMGLAYTWREWLAVVVLLGALSTPSGRGAK